MACFTGHRFAVTLPSLPRAEQERRGVMGKL